jgi:hypothetical protein
VAEPLTIGLMAATAIGAVGAVLDYVVPPKTKDQIRLSMEKRLYAFNYRGPRTFGVAEMEWSLGQVNKLLGQTLFSRRRLIAVVVVLLLSSGLAFAATYPHPIKQFSWATFARLVAPSILMLPLSFSLTVWLSRKVLRIPGGASVVGLFSLLLVHLAILVAWKPVTYGVELAIVQLLSFDKSLYGVFLIVADAIPQLFLPITRAISTGDLTELRQLYYKEWLISENPIWFSSLMDAMTDLAALLANCLRVALSVVFIVMALYVRGARPIVVAFWSAFVRPENLLFTPPASAIAAVVLVMTNWSQIKGVLLRLFTA